MKFWKINEKALRCVLNFDELKEQNIRLEDMILGNNNAREFLNNIIIQACLELDMELGSQKLSVHVMPLPGERVDLVISEFDDTNNRDCHNISSEETSLIPSIDEALNTQPSTIVPELMDQKVLFAVYRFSALKPIEQFAKRIEGIYCKKSALFKEPHSGFYYLCILEKRKKFRNLTDIASEYGILYSMDPIMQESLKEHCETLLKKHAITQLAKL